MARLVHIELASIDEILNLNSDALSLVEILLQVIIGLLELLHLLESSSELSTCVAFKLFGLFDLLLRSPPLSRDLHQV